MNSTPPSLLVITGLQREARIAASNGVVTLCSGGDPDVLRERLAAYARTGGHARVSGVLSFGLAGGLASHLRSGDVVVSTIVESGGLHHRAHDGWHQNATSALEARLSVHRGTTAGRDHIQTKSAEKITLHKETGALAVDMESHIAADYAHEHGLPFAAIRAISDPCTRNLPPIAADALTPDGKVAVGKVIMGILRDTGQLPALIAAGMDSERAFASLRRCRRLLGPLFGFVGPHL
ncbi:MAG: phosphorylase [Pseudorhodoplanes sp.]